MLESRVKVPAGGRRPYWPWDPPSLLFSAYRDSFLAAERPSCEIFHLPPSFAEVENEWMFTSAPLICFSDVDGESSIFFAFSSVTYAAEYVI